MRSISKEQHQINNGIRAKEIRLLGVNGEQLGIYPIREALGLAEEANLDLVNIAPTAKPNVCKIMDYGRFLYEQSKRSKELRKNQKIVQTKEVRLSPGIEENDIQIKLKNIKKFLENGDKVKVGIRFRGREITRQNFGRKVLERVASDLEELAMIERHPKLEGRQMIMILKPK